MLKPITQMVGLSGRSVTVVILAAVALSAGGAGAAVAGGNAWPGHDSVSGPAWGGVGARWGAVGVGASARSDASAGVRDRSAAPTVTVGGNPIGVAVDQATRTVYVANNGDNTVSVINAATCNGTQRSGCGQAPALVTVGPAPWGIAVSQASNTIYVANNNAGDGPASLSVIDGATCDATNTSGCSQVPPAIPGVGRAPNGIAVDQFTHTVYTANALDATVSVIDVGISIARHPASPPRVAVGSLPEAIAIDTGDHTIYIADAFDGTVSILSERPVRAPRTTGSATPERESARLPMSRR